MNDPETDNGRVVLTIRSDRECLVLNTTDGTVTIHLHPRNKVRTQAVIEAPRKVGVRRDPLPQEIK